MRQIIIIFATTLLLCNFAYGQTDKVTYEKAVDYMNCKTVELSLKDGDNKENYDNYLKKVPCNENVSNEKIIQYLTELQSYRKTIELSQEIETLKKQLRDDSRPETLATLLSEEVFKEGSVFRKLADFGDRRKDNPDFAVFKSDLKRDLMSKLSVQTKDGNSSSSNNSNLNSTPSNNSIATQAPASAGGFSYESLIPWIILLLLLAINGFLFYTKLTAITDKLRSLQNSNDALKERVNNLIVESKKTVKVTPPNANESGELKRELNDLKNRFETFLSTYEAGKRITTGTGQRQQGQQFDAAPVHNFFYLSTPSEDGSFDEKYASPSYKEGASIYKFTKTSGTEARFQIDDNEDAVKLALQFPDKAIDPVCEAHNAVNQKANRIITVESGKAVLDGDRWKVTRKAQIKYE